MRDNITNYATYELKIGAFEPSHKGQMEWYFTQLPPRKILEKKLRKAIDIAQEKYARLQYLTKKDD